MLFEMKIQSIIVIILTGVLLQRCSASAIHDVRGSQGTQNEVRHNRATKEKKFDPKELNKPLLDENSLEENYAERMVVYLDGKKTKPKNINSKPKESQVSSQLDRHPPSLGNDPQPPVGTRRKRHFIAEENVKWPHKIIPYQIETSTFNSQTNITAVFQEAVSLFNEAGCVKWVPRTSEEDYISVIGNQLKCSSFVGHLGVSGQKLWLYEYGCVFLDVALHEMLHAAGAMHEQSREDDRDKTITLNWDSIPRQLEMNYRGYKTANAREYDLGSVLQYPLKYGTIRLMYASDPDLAYLTENMKTDLSFYDKAELNAFYQCTDDCTNPPVCQNEGFVKQVNGECSCQCVEGLTGPDCTQLDTSPKCGNIINLEEGKPEKITMFNYNGGLKCTWLIKGTPKTKIQVKIDSLDLPTSDMGNCYHYLEIRDYLTGAPGKLICGNSDGGEFTKKNLGPTNIMIVRFDSDQYETVTPGKGFSLTVTAAPSACSSSPCKYPATCVDGATTDEYTCTCTEGYSGTNCDTVPAFGYVTDSFEDDFLTLMKHTTVNTDFKWSTGMYHNLNGNLIRPTDGHLMAIMANHFFRTTFYYTYKARMETTVKFERADRCLRFDYAISDRNIGGAYTTSLTVTAVMGSTTITETLGSTANVWRSFEMSLEAADDLKISIRCVFGFQQLVLDNIRISPFLCNVPTPCDGVECPDGRVCQATSTTTYQCRCPAGVCGDSPGNNDMFFTCDFETINEPFCFLEESNSDQFDFTRKTGETPTSNTGPTSAALGSYYKYAEASGHHPGDEAILQSNVPFAFGTYCLSLSIHMEGKESGSLSILTQEGTENAVLQTQYSGEQTVGWFRASTEMDLTPFTKIMIKAVRGGKKEEHDKGDVAIDNVELKFGPCSN
ncbi:uncharacterized protein [Magallana gigas]|uniref:uncharacterized protein n=1 Tax=Magallana gigas TaxID=29159 RepID=UPI00333EE24D